MIEVRGLTKRFGSTVAVDDLSFNVPAGVVTGFLGPNGAGKSTTMRVILGLDRPTKGDALVLGRSYTHSPSPMHEVGALLDAKDVHGGRSARSHLLALAQSNGIPERRVDEVLELVGLSKVAKRRIKGFSLGMSQRLGIAGTMLGDPKVLLFDEPVNGLDPEGILWIRNFMRSLAAEGRTVFVSSHLMSEMAQTADHLVVIGRGRLIADLSTKDFIAGSSGNAVRVKSPQQADLAALFESRGRKVTGIDGYLSVLGVTCAEVGDLAAGNGITIHELFQERASLEEAFMEMTRDSVEFQAPTPAHSLAIDEPNPVAPTDQEVAP
ncbi:MAG TPA: ABC transporter ATP-binding protein [Mycobacteriales bacterium]|jgi:ABC-2 type transport system ATP-binding protein|nr:ABC transporter ATP-binding protein [Mycobacteriales bacterium]